MNTMDKDDLKQIEKAVGALITHKIDEVSNKFDEKLIVFKDEIKDEFRHQLGIQSGNFQYKLDIVVEGHQMLSEKIDHAKTELSQKIECVERKLDVVAADLKAHREDTEVHKKVYKVKEE